MVDTTRIREHSEVIGSDGAHVGTVDHVDGNSLKLTKNDTSADGQHHWLPLDTVDSVEGQQVRLSISAQEAQAKWSTQSGQAL